MDHDIPLTQSMRENFGQDRTSGCKNPVWIATEPYSKRPQFPKLNSDIETDVIIVGGGITGISAAGHLSSALDDRYYELIKTFGEDGARKAFESHQYALERVGDISKHEGIECEYRNIPGLVIVEVPDTDPSYAEKNDLPQEYEACKKLGVNVNYIPNGKLGEAYTGAILEFPRQATYHPTKYLNGLLDILAKNPNNLFSAYTHTRMNSHKDHGNKATVTTEGDYTITARHMIMATNVPLHLMEIITKEAYYRTYCIGISARKGAYEDKLLYTNSDPYVYVRKTAHPDPSKEYLVVGGEDHKVGQESPEGYETHYDNLIKWTQKHFPYVAPNDYLAFTGVNTGMEKNVYVNTGDSGNGPTHGVIAGRLIPDLITGQKNKWADLYDPSRKPKANTASEVISENVDQNLKYSRWLKTDIGDIEELKPCSGGVTHGGLTKLGKPLAVYKDGEGNVTKFSAVCPHLGGIAARNDSEKSWDCPGDRYDGVTGKCIMGPSNRGLGAESEIAEQVQVGSSG
ncbi:FAD/NAD(P)-binding domain-containing protein [Choiromyces venosus 120613-1]|uniref:FAD/NAD(P)-binding domain-containing protein n=1 Tax=Choiromyces venosus 120613-1 TaxID=1336337 RepID=A0A3N4JS83_9PEZI|nr:FAD/NAD(P)-binding domain-containing protein [Choiromyces venosus 120613-1]